VRAMVREIKAAPIMQEIKANRFTKKSPQWNASKGAFILFIAFASIQIMRTHPTRVPWDNS